MSDDRSQPPHGKPDEANPDPAADTAVPAPEESSADAADPTTAEAPSEPVEAPPPDGEPSDEPPAEEAVVDAAADGPAVDEGGEAEPADKSAAPRKPKPRRPKDPALARAFRSRRPVQGRVVAVIKGGYEIRFGATRAFCPHSQIDVARVEDPESMIDRTVEFRITQFRRGGEDIVVSRRALLEADREEEAKAVRATLIEGAVMRGHVVGTADFGAFVDLGAGVQGLVHVSEISHTRVTNVADALKVGDPVDVKILRLQDGGRRISLSIRRAQPDPWKEAAARFEPGKIYPGKVVRLADFGAFVELAPGVEALAPAREFPPGTASWDAGVQPGHEGNWFVLAVEPRRRRMSVIPAIEGMEEGIPELKAGEERTGRVQRIERFGVFVWLGPGQVGLMPTMWAGLPKGTRLDARFKIGAEIEVQIVEIAEGGKRIRLAAKGVDATAEDSRGPSRGPSRRESRESRAEAASAGDPSESFGNPLADALRAALERKPKSD